MLTYRSATTRSLPDGSLPELIRTDELAECVEWVARLLREHTLAIPPKVIVSELPPTGQRGAIDKGDPRNVEGLTVAWGRSVLEPTRGHVREMHAGQPVADDVGGALVGMALCGALLIDDLAPDIAAGAFHRCSTCLELLEEINRATVDQSPGQDLGD